MLIPSGYTEYGVEATFAEMSSTRIKTPFEQDL